MQKSIGFKPDLSHLSVHDKKGEKWEKILTEKFKTIE
jgi:hypothetical protein